MGTIVCWILLIAVFASVVRDGVNEDGAWYLMWSGPIAFGLFLLGLIGTIKHGNELNPLIYKFVAAIYHML